MLILQIALGILLAGFLYRYWRKIGMVALAIVALVVAVIYWQEVLGFLIAVPVTFLLLSAAKPPKLSRNDSGKMR